MKLVFIINRSNHHRFYYSVIREALARKVKVECWHNYDPTMNPKNKAYLFPKLESAPQFKPFAQPEIKIYKSREQLEQLLLDDPEITFIVNIFRPETTFSEEFLKRRPFKWVTMMEGPDNFTSRIQLIRTGKKIPQLRHGTNYFFTYSEDWINTEREYLDRFAPNQAPAMKCKNTSVKVVGRPEFDAFANIDPKMVRRKYGIPEGKEIFLYLPYTYYTHNKGCSWGRAFGGVFIDRARLMGRQDLPYQLKFFYRNLFYKTHALYKIFTDPFARSYWIKGCNEGTVIKSVKQFCNKNNLFLVIKPRVKFPVTVPVQKAADLIVWDRENQFYPSSLHELTAVSRMTFSFQSFSVTTSVFGNSFHLSAALPGRTFLDDAHRFWFGVDHPSMFNFKGVCEPWSIEDIIHKLPDTPIERFEFDMEARAEYVRKYIGFDDFHSSKRVLDELEFAAMQCVESKG